MTEAKPHVLYVEDNEATRYVVNRVLAGAGYRVTSAASGDPGVALARASHPDLVLLDVKLPDTTGFEVCRRLKSDAQTSGIPVVFLSASHVSAQDKVIGLEGGADMYLTHPVEPHVLVAALGALLRVRRAEAKYLRLMGSNVVAVAEFDLDGQILDANEEYLRITGHTREELAAGRVRWKDVIAPAFQAEADRRREEFARMGAVPAHEMEYLRADGTNVSIITAAASLGRDERGIMVAVDVSERKRAEREREEALARAEAAQGRLSFLLSVSTALMGEPASVVNGLRRVAGLCAGVIADWCAVDRLLPSGEVERLVVVAADPARHSAALSLLAQPPVPGQGAIGRTLASGAAEHLREVRNPAFLQDVGGAESRAALGALGVAAASVYPLAAQGRTLGALTLVRSTAGAELSPLDAALGEEVASRAAAALENARLHEHLAQAVRAREDALAEVSHELRNPLSAIVLAAVQLERGAERTDPEIVRRAAATVTRSGERMKRLVNDLLDLARFESGGRLSLELGRHDAGEIVSEAVDAALQGREGDARVGAAVPPGTALECDRGRVHRVLVNLLSNAIKASPPLGRVTASAQREGDWVVFAVQDEGPGVPPELRVRLFERYSRGRDSERGVGIGLSIAKAIVESHGGRIWLEGGTGGDTRFLFRLPLAAQPPRPPESASHE